MKEWEKTKLSGGFDLDEQMRDPDFEEEFLFELMKDLILEEEEVEDENGLLTDESGSNQKMNQKS